MDPVFALEHIAHLLERAREPAYRAMAFRKAADAIRDMDRAELEALAAKGALRTLPNVGEKTARVIEEALRGETPAYLRRLEVDPGPEPGLGAPLLEKLRGDLHLHSDWSDGGSSIEAMTRTAAALGHEYVALTDHSPRLNIARGLSPERLRDQLDVVDRMNEELAPFRVLTGIEVDINEDGTLDQEEDLLERLDVVVASVHSKLRMDADAMTERMLRAIANPHSDILGHCTGRIVVGRGRPESTFDADLVFAACARFDTAVEINSRPERLDPPKRLLRRALELGCKFSIDTDAHATGQLEWQHYGADRAAECEVPAESIVNTWPVERLLEWTASHAA
ncbi:MAG TPA: PHP domain-containing protein [Acidimicrobiia bacterium]